MGWVRVHDGPVAVSVDPEDEHISRRELKLMLKELESRLTVKILIAAVAGSAIGKAVSPSVAVALGALGALGWGAKAVVVAVIHR